MMEFNEKYHDMSIEKNHVVARGTWKEIDNFLSSLEKMAPLSDKDDTVEFKIPDGDLTGYDVKPVVINGTKYSKYILAQVIESMTDKKMITGGRNKRAYKRSAGHTVSLKAKLPTKPDYPIILSLDGKMWYIIAPVIE